MNHMLTWLKLYCDTYGLGSNRLDHGMSDAALAKDFAAPNNQ